MHPKLRFSNKCSAFTCLYGAHRHSVRKQLLVLTVTAAPWEDVPQAPAEFLPWLPPGEQTSPLLALGHFPGGLGPAGRVCCVPQGQGSPSAWWSDAWRGAGLPSWFSRKEAGSAETLLERQADFALSILQKDSVCLVVRAENQAQTSDA